VDILSRPESMNSNEAPTAVGPYSHAVKVENFIFLSGQIGADPKTNLLVEADIEKQTQKALDNLEAVLKSCGSEMSNVVKTTVFLTDINNFGKMNEVYSKKFGSAKPARSTVEVSKLPKGALVEIDAVAVL